MKLMNITPCKVGGGMQVARSLVEALTKNNTNDYVLVIEKSVFEHYFNNQLSYMGPVEVITYNNLFNRNRQLNAIVKKYQINSVLSVFGPAYWRPKCYHLVGFALPWMVYTDLSAFKDLSFFNKVKKKIFNYIRKEILKYEADFFWCETDDVKCRLESLFPHKGSIVCSNSASESFINGKMRPKRFDRIDNKKFVTLTISHFYTHKNLLILKSLKEFRNEIQCLITIDDEKYNEYFSGYEDYIVNLGPVKVDECLSLYQASDCVIQPSLMECFSANYVEAFYVKKNLVVSDFPFSRTVCKDSAFYFNDHDELCSIIKYFLSNNNVVKMDCRDKMIHYNRLINELDTPDSRFNKLNEILNMNV